MGVKERIASWVAAARNWLPKRSQRYPKAYPSDTYIANLSRATKTRRSWTGLLQLIVVLSVLADFYLLNDAFAWMLGTESFADAFSDILDRSITGDTIEALFPALICIALVLIYLTLCRAAGNRLAEFRALKRKSALSAFLVFAVLIISILGLISFVRYYSIWDLSQSNSSSNALSGLRFSSATDSSTSEGFSFGGSNTEKGLGFDPNALIQTLGLVSVMLLGAFLEMLHAYCSIDPFAAEKRRIAEAHVAEDHMLYETVFARHAINPERILDYEKSERELDRKAINCSFRVSELATQLNGIVDPADAHDFCEVGRIVRDVRFGVEN